MTPAPARGDGRGELALVLHAHMPYVEGFDTWPFGEEWLWEAVATVYLPLLDVVGRAPVTLGLTPVLCDQLETLTGPAGERFLAFLRALRAPLHAEDAAGLERAAQRELAWEVRRAACDYAAAEARFLALGGDLLGAFRRLGEDGAVEFVASAATHAVLPLVATEPARRLQIAAGLGAHARRFGAAAGGFWLPECAYEPGLEHALARAGVSAFCIEQTAGLGLGAPEQLEPVATEAGPVAVPVDRQAVALVWDQARGYPAHPAYRDYHRGTAHGARPWSIAGRPYDHAAALALARYHARDFLRRAAARLDAHRAERGCAGLLCCALDAELLGHWWYEGQAWLAAVLEEAPGHGVRLATLSDALERVPAVARPLAASTWGRCGDLSTWDCPAVGELAFSARRRELGLVQAADAARPQAALAGRPGAALERAARELLALQASDWAFLASRGLAGDYPRRRVEGHARAMEGALAALQHSAPPPEPRLRNLAPELDLAPLAAP